MHFIKRLKRAAHRAWIKHRMVRLVRSHKVIYLTPLVKGKTLAFKPMPSRPEFEREARKAMELDHALFPAQHYTFRLSKRYPSIKWNRVERFEDYPSLKELIENSQEEYVQRFLRLNKITQEDRGILVAQVLAELRQRLKELNHRQGVYFDANEGNFLVTGFNRGKLELVMVDG